ncbi:class I adenylate-forming enzyme family protein [Streptomyces sp. NPDC048251]|uniref:class I adenylate-forming enzyme family protein n=1 Tax=Streptomyces sp. NPDC048251 TaxID=3154501 RepID=UPI0034285A3F
MADDPARWGDTVVRSTVRGRPTLVYEHRPRSVCAFLRESRRWHDREFIVHGSRRVTFADHESAVRRTAAAFAARGVGAGDRVAIFAANCPEWPVAFFAALELGAIAVPCNGWWSAPQVAHACELTGPRLIVADDRRADRLPAGSPVVLVDELRGVAGGGGDELLPGVPVGDEDEERPAVVLFTSGTTGLPKGVTLSHRAVVANVQSLLVLSRRLPRQLADDQPVTVTLTGLPLFHIGAIQLMLQPFVTGAKLVFPDGRFDAGEVLRLIETERVNVWGAVPTMVERVLAHPDLSVRDVSSVRTVGLGGSTVSPHLLERIPVAFPNAVRGTSQVYGLSEAGGVLATSPSKKLVTHKGAVGCAVPVAELRIDEPDAAGIGEIVARSPAVMDGYWSEPDDSVFTPDGWLRSGDLGWLDADGYLYVTGRKKDLVVRGGENIAPAHIESCLLKHPAVREAAVVGLPHRVFGEEVGAIVSLLPGADPSEEDLAGFLRPDLAPFEMPTRWWLCHDDLPKGDTGKIVKYELLNAWVAKLRGEGTA